MNEKKKKNKSTKHIEWEHTEMNNGREGCMTNGMRDYVKRSIFESTDTIEDFNLFHLMLIASTFSIEGAHARCILLHGISPVDLNFDSKKNRFRKKKKLW